MVRVGPQEAVSRGLMQDRVRAVMCWIDLRSPAYRARVGGWTYERERNGVVKLAGWACHAALSLEEAAVSLNFFVFYAGTVAGTFFPVRYVAECRSDHRNVARPSHYQRLVVATLVRQVSTVRGSRDA